MSKRIELAMRAKDIDQTQLAALMGVSPQAVQQWVSGKTSPKGARLVKLSNILGAQVDWLVRGDPTPNIWPPFSLKYEIGKAESNAHPAPELGRFKAVPVVGTAQLGDNGHWTELEYPVGHGDGYINFPTADPNAYALRCVGDSMKPRIKPGEFVIVEPNREPIPGDEVLIKALDGRVMVKTLLYRRENLVHVMSINELHPPQAFALDEIDKIHPVAAIVNNLLWVKS